MRGEQISAALNMLDDDIILEAARQRQDGKKRRPRMRWAAIAACLCCLIIGSAHVLQRFEYNLAAGCGAYPGEIVDGVYYYYAPHSGVWSYEPGGESEKLLSTFWMEEWQVNDYGIYYWQGMSVYVRDHASGGRRQLYSASRGDCTHIRFDLLPDGNLVCRCYNKHSRIRYELLLEGKTGETLGTVLEPVSYRDFEISYSEANLVVGERRLQLVPTGEEGGCDLMEKGESILPPGVQAGKYNQLYLGDSLLLEAAGTVEGQDLTHILLRPDGQDELVSLSAPGHFYGGIEGYLFYPRDNDSLWCLEITTKKTWELEADAEYEVHDFAMDENYIYTTVPWDDHHACWRLNYDTAGRPMSLTLVSPDIQSGPAS